MENQKSLIQSVIEMFILLKRNIFHILYFLFTGIVIGVIYANWVMDVNYQSVGKIEIRQTANEAQLVQIVTMLESKPFLETVATALNEKGFDDLPDGSPLTSSYIEQGIDATYVINSPIITVKFNSSYQELTLETINVVIDEFVEYGNANLPVVNNKLFVYELSAVAAKTGLSTTMIYGLAVALGITFGAVVVVLTDYSSGKVLFGSDLEAFGFRVYNITKVKAKKNDELEIEKGLTNNVLTLQNNLESNIWDRNLQTLAFVYFNKDDKTNDLLDLVAKTYALNEQKTLIIDLDLVSPNLHDNYEVENKVTIVDVVEKGLEEISYKKLQNSLYFLGGKEVTYPSKFFKSDELRKSLDFIKKDFDIVIFKLSCVQDDFTNLNALDQFDFVLLNVFVNKTSKKKVNEYVSVVKKHEYENVVFNIFDH